jgi:Co/Zn/Cd efflux system component
MGVVASAIIDWLGLPIGDPISGLLITLVILKITLVILKITWDSWQTIYGDHHGQQDARQLLSPRPSKGWFPTASNQRLPRCHGRSHGRR